MMGFHALLFGGAVILALFALWCPASSGSSSGSRLQAIPGKYLKSGIVRLAVLPDSARFLRIGEIPDRTVAELFHPDRSGAESGSATETARLWAVQYRVQQERGRGVPAFVEEFLLFSMPERAAPNC